ncbi:MAG: hypothetical protein KatS3mg110_3830 [Pirellulaceae bacterium]|nr:MAG: hypothetical protein KatS3mg110_3830 [Pirellulaceae bacterium]
MTRRLLRLDKEVTAFRGSGIKWKLRKLRRETKDKHLAERCQIVLLAAKRSSQRAIAESVGCHQSGVSRVLKRFREEGVARLFDRREDNGRPKVDDSFVYVLMSVVSKTPRDFGYVRPTWTLELLVAVMTQQTGVKVHISTLWRVLRMIKARRGRPKPVAICRMPEKANKRRVAYLRRLAATKNRGEHVKPVAICRMPEKANKRRVAYLRRLAATKNRGEHVFYVDEVDIHLNPKIGADWMLPGQQKQIGCYLDSKSKSHSRQEPEVLYGGCFRCSDTEVDLDRWDAQEQCLVPFPGSEATGVVPASQTDPFDTGQF